VKNIKITEKQFNENEYPYCFRCLNFKKYYSKIYGEGYDCVKGKNYIEIYEQNILNSNETTIKDCGSYEFGIPNTYILK